MIVYGRIIFNVLNPVCSEVCYDDFIEYTNVYEFYLIAFLSSVETKKKQQLIRYLDLDWTVWFLNPSLGATQ